MMATVFTSAIPAYAAEQIDKTQTIEAISPICGNDLKSAGALTPDELKQLIRKNNISTRAGSSRVYKYVTVSKTYDGFRDRGDVTKGTNKTDVTDTLGFNISRTVRNTVSLAAGISKSDVEAKVGYSVDWSETYSWSYSAEVKPKKTVYIGYKDWYHTSVLKYKTETQTWLGNSLTPTTTYKYGDGWSDQWYLHEFYSHY